MKLRTSRGITASMRRASGFFALGLSAASALAAPAAPGGQSFSVRQNDGGIKPSFNTTSCPGYKLAGEPSHSASGFTVPLMLAGEACNAFGVDIHNLTLSVVHETAHRLHVHIHDAANQQFQLPHDLLPRPSSDPTKVKGVSVEESDLHFHHTGQQGQNSTEDAWAFWIERKSSGEIIFDTRPSKIPTYDQPLNGTEGKRNSTAMPNHNMIFENQYLQLSSALPDDANIYGLGEYITGNFRRDPNNTLQPFFTLDAGDPIDSNMYGYHPVYLETRVSGDQQNKSQSHMVYLQSTAGADVILRNRVIQYRLIGGTLDFYFFSGDSETKTSSSSNTGTNSNSNSTSSSSAVTQREVESEFAEMSVRSPILETRNDSQSESKPKTSKKSKSNSPVSAIEQYVQFIGLPQMTPAWGLGFHLCRWGYSNVSETQDVVRQMREADIPLEVQWNDIDWMQIYRDFIPDPERYRPSDFKKFIEQLHSDHQHYIPIIDAAIPIPVPNGTDTYAPTDSGRELDVFLRHPNGTEYIGQVWPGFTYFPDWHADKSQEWWTAAFKNFSEIVPFDGIWLDMNEPSSFGSYGSSANLSNTPTYVAATSVDGWPEGYDNNTFGNSGNRTVNGTSTHDSQAARKRSALPEIQVAQQIVARQAAEMPSYSYANESQRYLNVPPYGIHNGINNGPGPLDMKTVSMDTDSKLGKQYDIHNIFGWAEELRTWNALQAIDSKKRPFLISRSTYPSSGKYTHHWLGDNYSTFLYMAKAIQGMLQFNIFGIPMVGPDVCGFNRNSDEELCNRWQMMGAFTPFFRNHNTQGAISQEPFRWDSVAKASSKANYMRLRILPYIYSTMARASQNGTPALRALWWEFPEQTAALRESDTQFLLGGNLLVSPVLEPNVSTVTAFFPGPGPWRSLWDHSVLNVTENTNTSVPAPLGEINVHIRPGTAMLTHAEPKYTVYETQQGPYELVVSLDKAGTAQGDAYIDDGETQWPTPSRSVAFSASKNHVQGSPDGGDYDVKQRLGGVIVLGVQTKPDSVMLGDKKIDSFKYDASLQRLNVTGIDGDLNKSWKLSWQ